MLEKACLITLNVKGSKRYKIYINGCIKTGGGLETKHFAVVVDILFVHKNSICYG